MKKLSYFLAMLIAITGCATTSYYNSYTSKRFPKKPKNFYMPFYEDKRPDLGGIYQTIGEFHVQGDTASGDTWTDVYDKAMRIAREKGADAAIDVKTSCKDYTGVVVLPGYTTHDKITTYHHGNSNIDIYGQQGESSLFGNTFCHGTFTTYIPVHHPPQSIPYNVTILEYTGKLIVFPARSPYVEPIHQENFGTKFSSKMIDDSFCVNYWNLSNDKKQDKVKRNMTQSEIYKILGKPNKVVNSSNTTIMWKYKGYDRVVFGKKKGLIAK